MTERPPPRLVATDLDGTIVRRDGEISGRTRDALAAAEAAGALVVLVTGRPPRWLGRIAEETGHHGLAICANGAICYDLHTEQVVDSRPIPADVVRRLMTELREAIPGIGFALETVTGRFGHESAYRPRGATESDTPRGDLEPLLADPVSKLLARHESIGPDQLLATARGVVGAEVATLTHSSTDGLLEISGLGVSKASALADLAAQRGLGPDDAIVFGDMPNDLPMFAWAGHCVAVANAHPEVLAEADEVTASNDDDGVAVVLERWFRRTG
jgi:Cof subfamily protein (haloacid dehalogenase superfamily)